MRLSDNPKRSTWSMTLVAAAASYVGAVVGGSLSRGEVVLWDEHTAIYMVTFAVLFPLIYGWRRRRYLASREASDDN